MVGSGGAVIEPVSKQRDCRARRGKGCRGRGGGGWLG